MGMAGRSGLCRNGKGRVPCPELMGMVLAGGRSSRMGTDKASLVLPDGRTFVKRACDLLWKLVPHVAVSWHSMALLNIPGVVDLYDKTPEIGPMGGLAAGLTETMRQDLQGMLVLPCDAPLITEQLMLKLVHQWRISHDDILATIYFTSSDKRAHPLVGVWDVRALPFLLVASGLGDYSLRSALPGNAFRYVPCPPDEEDRLMNVNTPADLERVLLLAGRDAAPCGEQDSGN